MISPDRPHAARIGTMRRPLAVLFVVQLALLAALGAALSNPGVALGVPGEWTWARLLANQEGPGALSLAAAAAVAGGYAAFVALGMRSLSSREGRFREGAWVSGLGFASIIVQVSMINGAPSGYDLARFPIVLSSPNSSGYYSVAAAEVRDPLRFWGEYPGWIRRQDELHVGTHPPGLVLATDAVVRFFRARPSWASWIVDNEPAPLVLAYLALSKHFAPLPTADRAALAVIGLFSLLACATTVAPLYVLARSAMPAPFAWAAAAAWPLVPSALMFLPTADAAFPLLSATALALASRGRTVSAIGAGVVMAFGLFCTLAFLPVGLIVGLVLATAPVNIGRRARLIAATGAGFLAPTLLGWAISGANPFVYWWWNLANHARFYVTYHRSYAPWVALSPVELAVGIGLPASAMIAIGLATKRAPRAALAGLAVLIVLNFSGRNLGEVARLWLPLMPPLFPALGAGFERLGAGPRTLAAMVLLTVAEVWMLQATIQVYYPM